MNPKDASVDADATRFSSTHWSIVLTAAQEQTPAGQSALADAEIHLLCEALVAAQGHLAQ